jgi:hypothetical protein
MKTIFYTISLLLALGLSARAAVLINATYGGGNAAIPDNNIIGLTESQNVAGPVGLDVIQSVTLTFTLAGGYGTDLQGYLRLGNLVGSPSYSLNSLVQSYPTISGSGVTFNNVDVTSAFLGDNPNDTWTLFFADTSPGGTTTLNGGWSLSIEAVPEPVNVALGIFGGLLGGLGLVRHHATKRRSVLQPQA